MKVLVFTPSNKPGFDVTLGSLKRQTYRDFVWAFGDDLYESRAVLVERFCRYSGIDFYHFDTLKKRPGFRRSTVLAYNIALDHARKNNFDLFISLQDYIWIPDDGVERFVRMAERNHLDLFTGICSISRDPEADKVTHPECLYTIFGSPYEDKPEEIDWRDVRLDNYIGLSGWVESNPVENEWNWAAIPKGVLDSDIWVDEDYDEGVAYENQAFAHECAQKLGSKVILDLDNQSISLPHKRYPFSTEKFDTDPGAIGDLSYNEFNRQLHISKWGL